MFSKLLPFQPRPVTASWMATLRGKSPSTRHLSLADRRAAKAALAVAWTALDLDKPPPRVPFPAKTVNTGKHAAGAAKPAVEPSKLPSSAINPATDTGKHRANSAIDTGRHRAAPTSAATDTGRHRAAAASPAPEDTKRGLGLIDLLTLDWDEIVKIQDNKLPG
jgi:hypothetical protein